MFEIIHIKNGGICLISALIIDTILEGLHMRSYNTFSV